MYTKITFILLFMQLVIDYTVAVGNQHGFRNDYKFFETARSYYKTHTIARTWSDAQMVCASENADLLLVEDQTEADIIIKYMNETVPMKGDIRTIYVGISDLVTEGAFKTIDGRSILDVYFKWKVRQPDNFNDGEDCLQLLVDGTLNDNTCSTELPFMCKKTIHSRRVKHGNNNLDRQQNNGGDYEYIETTNSFYKTHTIPTTWLEAQRICASESANLLVIENQIEANVIVSFMNETSLNSTLPEPPHQSMHIGISDLETEGTYKTIDGRSISDVYNTWRKGQPDITDAPDKDCVDINKAGELIYIDCKSISRFICKKTLDSMERLLQTYQQNEPFFRNDYKYIEATRSFYKTHLVSRPWLDAEKTCVNENAELLVVEDQKEADIILSFMDQMVDAVYLGISDLLVKKHFYTIDSRPVADVYNKWLPGEPNNLDGDEDCVELRKNGGFNNVPCRETKPFICKKTLDSLQWNHQCNMSFLDYTYNETLNRCYKFHSNPFNWTDAHALCIAEQSYLAVINSQNEADYFVQLMEEYNRDKSEDCVSNQVFLGFHNKLFKGWTTVQGTTLERSGYANWSPGQPDSNDRDKCGSMVYDGYLNDVACDAKTVFICEHEVDRPSPLIDVRLPDVPA